MTLSDLEGRGRVFRRISVITLVQFDLAGTIHMREGRLSRGRPCPHPKDVWPKRPQKLFGTHLLTYAHTDDTASRFCMMIKLDGRKVLLHGRLCL